MRKIPFARPLFIIVLCMLFFCTGCGEGKQANDSEAPPELSFGQVLEPEAPGENVAGSDPLTLDISHTGQGYFTALSQAEDTRINLQVNAPDGVLYSYFVEPGENAVIPFTSGDGEYLITCYQQVSGSQYAALYTETLDIVLENQFLPFLYPNQYVDFSPESQAVQTAMNLAAEDAPDLDILDAAYTYVTTHIVYDEEKAVTVEAGYLPDVDATLEEGTGICFDYAALLTAMLRSRGIPCRLQIGYAGEIKHAWIDVYIRSKGWINKAISFEGGSWTRMDPTFASNSEDAELIQEYIGDGTNYTVQFTR